MCAPAVMGIASFAKGAMGAMGSAAQAKARNRAAIQNYEYQRGLIWSVLFEFIEIWKNTICFRDY